MRSLTSLTPTTGHTRTYQQSPPAVRQPRRGHPPTRGHEPGRTETALGAFHRRVAFRIGKAMAVTATARQLAILIYQTLKHGLVYADPGAEAYDTQHRTRVLRRLRRRAANLRFGLVNLTTGEVAEGTVSWETAQGFRSTILSLWCRSVVRPRLRPGGRWPFAESRGSR